MTRLLLSTCLTPLLVMFLALFILIVQGCGGSSGGGGVTPDANPMGYYINTSDVQGGAVAVGDLQAMVNGDRIMMMSVDNGLLYDGRITGISGTDFTADFTIYTKGEFPVTATASGTITTGSSITGTLSGSGVGSGTFRLLYATTNDEVADVARIENTTNATWEAKVGGSIVAQKFTIDNMGVLTDDFPPIGGVFSNCVVMNGNITPISGSSLYSVSVVLTGCGSSTRDGTYTGLATSRTEAITDDTLVFAVTNGSWGLDGDFK